MVTRLDALATLYLIRPVLRLRKRVAAGLPILMYHSISPQADKKRHPYYWTNTTPARFELHMQTLRDMGISAVSLRQAASVLQSAAPGNRQFVCITFDDGFQDVETVAMPILQRHGFGATVFLPTQYIGDTPRLFKNRYCLTWDRIRHLHKTGIEFGSHTVSHPQLSQCSDADVKREVSLSKDRIEQEIGASVTSFSYPYAFPVHRPDFLRGLRQHLVESGYTTGCTTMIGSAHARRDLIFLPRIPVSDADDYTLLDAKLNGCYNWIGAFQRIIKLISRA